jgi:hypothetical protein
MKVASHRGVGCEPKRDEQRPCLAAEERCGVVMPIRREARLGALELERAQRGSGEVE